MATLATLKAELNHRLGDASNTVWGDSEKAAYVAEALASLYPAFYRLRTGTTTAGSGPLQTLPSGAINLYFVGVKNATSNRARTIRGWREGVGEALVPKVNISGQQLIWAWTEPHEVPANTAVTLTIPVQAEEVVILRAHITALERLISSRIKTEKYFAIQVREGVTESEIVATLDALHASVDSRLQRVVPLPERVG